MNSTYRTTHLTFRALLVTITLLLFFTGCDNDDNKIEIIEPVGIADYFIRNRTDIDLSIVFSKSKELGNEVDSTKIVLNNNNEKILEDAIIGVNPRPSNSFEKIEFFEAPVNKTSEPLFTISPIINDNWVIVQQNLNSNGLGITVFEFVITNDSIN